MQASLRWHLTYWLIGPLLLLVTAGSFVSYRIALNAATQAYDSALLDPVLAIASHLRRTGDHLELDLPSIAIEALRIDTEDRVYYQVLGPDGELIAGTPRLPAPPERLAPEEHIFYDARLEGERVRVAARAVKAEPGTAIVQVAETLVKRDKLVLELLLASTAPQLLIAFAAVALLWFSIGQGLRPLDRLRQEIAARSPRDLRPVPEQDKPQEVRPLVGALNGLLFRLNAAIESQQRFIANAAHQLRTPLAGLKTHAELARRQPSGSELKSLLDMIAGETQRTSHLVNQLLTLARAEPGEAASRQPVNLHEIIGRDLRDWVQRAVGKNIDLGFELQDAWVLCCVSWSRICSTTRSLIPRRAAASRCAPGRTTASRCSRSRTTGPAFLNPSARRSSSASIASPRPEARVAGWDCPSFRRSPNGTARAWP